MLKLKLKLRLTRRVRAYQIETRASVSDLCHVRPRFGRAIPADSPVDDFISSPLDALINDTARPSLRTTF